MGAGALSEQALAKKLNRQGRYHANQANKITADSIDSERCRDAFDGAGRERVDSLVQWERLI